jgi:DNA-binding transcriptional regulator YhcF (GntR family)
MAIRIDLGSPVPAYRQVADAIRVRLVDGSLPPGEQLPPVRHLALDLGVHFNTVAEAYRTLAGEGWLDLKRRRGAVVLKRTKPKTTESGREEAFHLRLRELAARAQADGIRPGRLAQALRVLAGELEEGR